MIYHEIMSLLQSLAGLGWQVSVVAKAGGTMVWTLHYLVIILPCVYSLDDDLTTNTHGEMQPGPGGVTTGHSLAITDRESLIEEEGSQNISDILVGNWTDGVLMPIYSIYDSQDNITELDTDDVEILRFGEVLTSTNNNISPQF